MQQKRESIAYKGDKPLSETIFRQEEKKFKHTPYEEIKGEILDYYNINHFDNLGNNIFLSKQISGLFVLPQYLSLEEQKYWVKQALYTYSNSEVYYNNIVAINNNLKTAEYTKDLRWSQLGVKYDWSQVLYQDKKEISNFPEDLSLCIKQIVEKVGNKDKIKDKVSYDNYNPEIAFVNYYPQKSFMMAHQDKSEYTYEKPLVSISLGCSCIFLIGTDDREVKPYALHLKSGDAICMTGKSRLSFHGVPKIYDDCPKEILDCDDKMKGLRININVRQVYN
jgi:alkylated DNA repair protein alkB family protein 1